MYKVHGLEDDIYCELIDRLDNVSSVISIKDLPYIVSESSNKIMAFCPDKENAENIVKALTLLKRVEKRGLNP